MNGRIDLLHVRCAGGDGEAADLVRRRLAETARNHLPEALGRALADDRRRIFAERVRVELDFDPAEYDDVTVAALWAGRIERALREEQDGPGPPAGSVQGLRVFASEREFLAGALREAAETGRLAWVYGELPCGAGERSAGEILRSLRSPAQVAAAAQALARDEALSRTVFHALEAGDRIDLVEAFVGERAWPQARALFPPAPVRGDAAAGREPAGERAARSAPGGSAGSAELACGAGEDGVARRGPSFGAWEAAVRAAAAARTPPFRFARTGSPPGAKSPARPEATRDSARPGPAGGPSGAVHETARAGERGSGPRLVAPSAAEGAPRGRLRGLEPGEERWSLVGGLVLLQPWLESYLDPEAVPDDAARVAALVELAGPTSPELALDPLVRVLAGAPLDDELADAELPLELDAAAVLERFAAALPGFGASSPRFLRVHFVARGALVAPVGDRLVRVVLEPLPLDPLLELLPYPLAPFRLPWTTTIVPERRRA